MNNPIIEKSVLQHAARNRKNRVKLQVLIVEDDDFSRTLVKKILRDCDVIEAANGAHAIKQYSLNAPDLLLLDVELPDFNGDYILAEVMKADPEAFVVMLTSHTGADFVKKALQRGVKGYIAKPFSKERILHYVAQCKSSK